MKKILPVLAVLCMSLLAFQVMAQTYVPITISSGFNQDLIANGNSSADASTSTYFDHPSSSGVYYSQDFYPGHAVPCGGLPNSGVINSASTSGVNYQLANYSGNNALLLVSPGNNGTLAFATPGCYERISICAASAVSTAGTVLFDARINFSDGSNTTYTFSVPDWFASGTYCIQGVGRTYRSGSTFCSAGTFDGCSSSGSYICTVSAPPCCSYARLFDCIITLSSTDKLKVINSITCTKTDVTTQKCGIFAICGVTATGGPLAVIADAATNIGTFNFDANWHPAPADPNPPTSYRLDVSTDPGFGSFVTGYNNLNVGSVVTLPVTGLSAATTYYYRVRGVNASGVGPSSNVITVTTLDNVPRAIIADPATNVLGTTFDANWHPDPTDPYPPTSYRLDVATTSTFNAGTFVTGYNDLNVGSAVTWPVTGLNISSTYYYRVRGVNIYGTGASSNVITVNTTDGLPPAPVATPATAVIQIKFWAHWNAGTPTPSEAVDCYYLDVATTPTFDPGTFVGIYNNLNVGLNTMCLITGTTPGTTYYYRVRAHNTWGLSTDSNVITVITVPSNIPTLSEWGLIILGLVLLGAGTLYIMRWHS